MRKNKVIMLSFALVIAVALLSFGFTNPEEEKKERKVVPKPESLIERLKLTPEQQKQMEKMKFDLDKRQVQTRAKMETAAVELKELLSADNPDREAIEKKVDEVAKYRVEMEKNKIEQWFTVNKILTPEQQKVWREVLKHPPREHARHMMMQRRHKMCCPPMPPSIEQEVQPE